MNKEARWSGVGQTVLKMAMIVLLLVSFVYLRYQQNVDRYDLQGEQQQEVESDAGDPGLEEWQQDFIDQGCEMVNGMVVCR